MVLKRLISLLVLTMYLHGMSGYTMSFHKCSITGFENVYASYQSGDPCGEEDLDCTETTPHFEQADCCDLEQTIINVDDDANSTFFKTIISPLPLTSPGIQSYLLPIFKSLLKEKEEPTQRPPEPSYICVFRI